MPDYEKAAERAARKFGVDPRIFKAMIRQESGFHQGLKSPAGARDIAQFIPSTAKAYGVTLGDNRVTDDLEGAAHYLRDNLKRTGGNYHRALSIYNSGRPEGYKHIAETSNYVAKILKGSKGEHTTQRGGSPSSSPSSKTVTKSRTIPGVDRSDERRQVILNFLQNRHHPEALRNLATGLRDTKDTPSVRATSSRTVKDSSSGGTGGKRSPLLELFYNGPGGVNVKDGQRQPKGFVSGHTDHVHVAAGPKTVVQIGHLAQRMGLNVTENPAFDKVDPVHVKGSYHYRNQAIDVSGDPARMREFNRRVARSYGIGR